MKNVEHKGKVFEVINNSLDLQGLGINDITEIKGFDNQTSLEFLYLHGNQIKEIKGLDKLRDLKILLLHYNQINEVRGLENLEKLEILNLLGNQITHIKGLDKLKNLKILNLSENYISEITGLSNLVNLQQLYLNRNNISNICGLDGLRKLEFLFIKENEIPDNTINELGGLSSEGKANNPEKFIEYCAQNDIIIEAILDPIYTYEIEPIINDDVKFDISQLDEIPIEDFSLSPTQRVTNELAKVEEFLSQHKFIEALELLENVKTIAIENELYTIADDLFIKSQEIKNQRLNFSIDNALATFKNTTMCKIEDIEEYLNSNLPDYNINLVKLKFRLLSRINSLNLNAKIHNNYIIFNGSILNQQNFANIKLQADSYKKKECMYCNEYIDDEAVICPYCGVSQE